MSEVSDITSEIEQLRKKRANLMNQQKGLTEDKIKSLEWTKECTGILDINPMTCAGLPAYKIHVTGPCPECMSSVTVIGDHKLYEYNMLYGKQYGAYDMDQYCFYTSCKKMLFQFMEKVEFKKFEYDKETWSVLEVARKKANGLD